jgi:hypothetical protein
MSTPVLVAIILLAVGCAATLTRLRLADRRSVAAHHRALQTMGRLVAQQPASESAATPEQPVGQAHVRLVDTADPAAPPPLPPLRTRPRTRSRQPADYRSWNDVAPAAAEFYPAEPVAPAAAQIYLDKPVAPPAAEPYLDIPGAPPAAEPYLDLPVALPPAEPYPHEPGAPAAAEVYLDLPGAPAAAELHMDDPVLPAPAEPAASRPMLYFDALAAPRPAQPKEEKEEVDSGRRLGPVGGRGPRRRVRVRRPRHRWGRDRRPALRFLIVGVLIVMVVAGGTVGVLTLRGDHNRASPPSHPPPRAAAPPAPVPTSATTVAPPPAPVLVTTSAGYSEYRLSGPATIVLTASGTCWVQIRRDGPTGTVLYQGDLYAGQTHPANGPIWLRLGNPTQVTITVNGTALSPPSLIAGEPYNLQFD